MSNKNRHRSHLAICWIFTQKNPQSTMEKNIKRHKKCFVIDFRISIDKQNQQQQKNFSRMEFVFVNQKKKETPNYRFNKYLTNDC